MKVCNLHGSISILPITFGKKCREKLRFRELVNSGDFRKKEHDYEIHSVVVTNH